jgi:hypothetical protein
MRLRAAESNFTPVLILVESQLRTAGTRSNALLDSPSLPS